MVELRQNPPLPLLLRQPRCTDLDSLPLLVGERFSRVAPLFWGEEVVKEFPESEVLPQLSSRLLVRPPLGLPFS